MLRVLLVHNFYGSEAPSGENQAYLMEKSLLESSDIDLRVYEASSDKIRSLGVAGMIYGGLSSIWNFSSATRIRGLVQEFRPHVVHVHNTFPLISNSIFPAVKGAARVITLHNYRLFCAAGVPMREGAVCTECLDKRSVTPSLKYGCYRGSRLATAPLSLGIALNRARDTWNSDVDAFIALTDFQRARLIEAGLPSEKIYVKPNFFPGNPSAFDYSDRKGGVVFVGRLSEEKGIDLLIDAWLAWGADAPRLTVVGDGPLRDDLERKVRAAGSDRVVFLGLLSALEAQRQIADSRLIVVPSRCFEGFPLVLREAFAFGTPSLVADIGPLPGLVDSGAGEVFRAGDARHLLEVARSTWSRPDLLERMSSTSRGLFERLYTETSNLKGLLDIYSSAMRRAGVVVED